MPDEVTNTANNQPAAEVPPGFIIAIELAGELPQPFTFALETKYAATP